MSEFMTLLLGVPFIFALMAIIISVILDKDKNDNIVDWWTRIGTTEEINRDPEENNPYTDPTHPNFISNHSISFGIGIGIDQD